MTSFHSPPDVPWEDETTCQAGGSGATRRLFLDPSSNFHPYECDGPGNCIHCDRRTTTDHAPASCALCDPEYDATPPAVTGEDAHPTRERGN